MTTFTTDLHLPYASTLKNTTIFDDVKRSDMPSNSGLDAFQFSRDNQEKNIMLAQATSK